MMSMDNIKISLNENQYDDVSEVRVDGVIDTITASELEEIIDTLVKRERYRVVIDLAGVDYISSAGWGIFISHIRYVRDQGGDIKLANMIPNVFEIYDLLEFDNVLKAYSSVDEARNDFDNQPPQPGLKKKADTLTSVSVVDQVATRETEFNRGGSVATMVEVAPDSTDTATLVLRCVKDDPFASIAEIKAEINSNPNSSDTSWWRVFSILKNKRLLKKRSRFRYVRGR